MNERAKLREEFKNKYSSAKGLVDNDEMREATFDVKRRLDAEADSARLGDITSVVKGSEIYQTYDLNKTAEPDIKERRQPGRVADGDFNLMPHKPKAITDKERDSGNSDIPDWLKKNIAEDDGNYDDAFETPDMKRQQFDQAHGKEGGEKGMDYRVEQGGNGLEDDPQGGEETPPGEDPAEREKRRIEMERQYQEAQEKFAEALAKRRGIFGGGPGHAEALAKAKDDYVKISSELLASKYDDKLRELEDKNDLSSEDKTNELNADAIRNKLSQEFELNDKIKDRAENGNFFRKIFSSVDRLPKALRPLARIAGSNGLGMLGWAGATVIGLANPVVGAAIAAGAVAAFTRPGYGGSAFEAHKDVLNAASDEKDKVVVDGGLARREGEAREDYFKRLDEAAQKFGKRSRERRAVQGLGHKEGMSEALDSIGDTHDKEEIARVFSNISDYLGQEQIELANSDKNKNRITTGVLSVAATALSIANIPFSKIPGLQDGGWGKMAVGRFGGAANYDRINRKLNPEEGTPSSEPTGPETPPPNEPEAETPTLTPETPEVVAAESPATAGEGPAEEEVIPVESGEAVEEGTGANPGEVKIETPETNSSDVSRGYSEDQYNRAVADVRALRGDRGGEARVSRSVIQRNLGIGVRVANDILARMRAEGVLYGDGRVRESK